MKNLVKIMFGLSLVSIQANAAEISCMLSGPSGDNRVDAVEMSLLQGSDEKYSLQKTTYSTANADLGLQVKTEVLAKDLDCELREAEDMTEFRCQNTKGKSVRILQEKVYAPLYDIDGNMMREMEAVEKAEILVRSRARTVNHIRNIPLENCR